VVVRDGVKRMEEKVRECGKGKRSVRERCERAENKKGEKA